jgi:hypothetical protein
MNRRKRTEDDDVSVVVVVVVFTSRRTQCHACAVWMFWKGRPTLCRGYNIVAEVAITITFSDDKKMSGDFVDVTSRSSPQGKLLGHFHLIQRSHFVTKKNNNNNSNHHQKNDLRVPTCENR